MMLRFVFPFVFVTALLLFSGQQRPAPSAAPEMSAIFRLPEDMKFPKGTPGNPRTITLVGHPQAEGLYVTRTLIPKGKQIIPHTHSDSRTVVVLSGTYYYGLGEEFDEKRLTAMPPGTFFTEPAGVPHFTWAKNEDVIIQTTAVGPSGTQIIPDKKPPAVASSASNSPAAPAKK